MHLEHYRINTAVADEGNPRVECIWDRAVYVHIVSSNFRPLEEGSSGAAVRTRSENIGTAIPSDDTLIDFTRDFPAEVHCATGF